MVRGKKRKSDYFTVFIASNLNKPIVRWALPKFSIYIMLLLIITPILGLFYVVHVNNQLQQENQMMSKSVDLQLNKIAGLQEKVNKMEKTKNDVENKLNQLESLESIMIESIQDLPVNIDPRGGITIPISEKDIKVQEKSINYDLFSDKLIEGYKQTIADIEATNEKLKYIPTARPTSVMRTTSPFGIRNDPFINVLSFHTGIDFPGPTGTPVYAGANGKVILAEYYGSYGKAIIIRHSNTYKTLYGHLSEIQVEQGQSVNKGDQIGLIGSTGRSTGPHLHYEVIKNGEPINPEPFINFLKNYDGIH